MSDPSATNSNTDPEVYPAVEPAAGYLENEAGLWSERVLAGGESRLSPVANFTARIVAEIIVDPGTPEQSREFETELRRAGAAPVNFRLSPEEFSSEPFWLTRGGAGYYLYPSGFNAQHVRTACQALSTPRIRRVYRSAGWEKIDGRWQFLTASGATGDGPAGSIEVELPAELARYALPSEPTRVQLDAIPDAIRDIQNTLGDHLAWIIVAAALRPAIGITPSPIVFLSGATGSGKSRLAAVVAGFFGPTITTNNLLSFNSTGQAVEVIAHAARHTPLVVDDFVAATRKDAERLEAIADQLTRSAFAESGRRRLTSEAKLRATRAVRAGLIFTGEREAALASARNRLLTIEVSGVDLEELAEIEAQRAAGVHAGLIAHLVKWAAPKLEEHRERFKARRTENLATLKKQLGRVDRSIIAAADLLAGLAAFFDFVEARGLVEVGELADWRSGAWDALTELADVQAEVVRERDECDRFLDLLRDSISSAAAHLAGSSKGDPPIADSVAKRCGWRVPTSGRRDQLIGSGPCIGWIDAERAYLFPSSALRVAAVQSPGDPLLTTEATLRRRLLDRGLILEADSEGRGTVKKTCSIGGASGRVRVLTLRRDLLIGTDDPNDTAADSAAAADNEPEESPFA